MQLSNHPKRQATYQKLVYDSQMHNLTICELAKRAEKLMHKAKLHHHFFGDFTLYQTSLHLCLFSLSLPYEYDDPALLNKTLTPEETLKIIFVIERRIAERIL